MAVNSQGFHGKVRGHESSRGRSNRDTRPEFTDARREIDMRNGKRLESAARYGIKKASITGLGSIPEVEAGLGFRRGISFRSSNPDDWEGIYHFSRREGVGGRRAVKLQSGNGWWIKIRKKKKKMQRKRIKLGLQAPQLSASCPNLAQVRVRSVCYRDRASSNSKIQFKNLQTYSNIHIFLILLFLFIIFILIYIYLIS